MYEYIKGHIIGIKDEYIVLDNNGIGYRVFTSSNSLANIRVGENIKMYIFFNLREDGISLYGFTTEEELDMFNMLLLVSRVGPRVGLGILSTLTPNQIKLAILSDDSPTLCKAPGIGNKTANRIILELKDRISKDEIENEEGVVENRNDIEVAIRGVMSLGYTRGEIVKITNKMNIRGMSTEDIIKEVLKRLSR